MLQGPQLFGRSDPDKCLLTLKLKISLIKHLPSLWKHRQMCPPRLFNDNLGRSHHRHPRAEEAVLFTQPVLLSQAYPRTLSGLDAPAAHHRWLSTTHRVVRRPPQLEVCVRHISTPICAWEEIGRPELAFWCSSTRVFSLPMPKPQPCDAVLRGQAGGRSKDATAGSHARQQRPTASPFRHSLCDDQGTVSDILKANSTCVEILN